MDYKDITEESIRTAIKDIMFGTSAPRELIPITKTLVDEYEDDWIERRTAELMDIIEPGSYSIGAPPYVAHTGKGGFIQYQLVMEKGLLEFKKR